MIWNRRKHEREKRLAEAKAAAVASAEQLQDSRAVLHRARNIGAEIRRNRERNHWGQALDHVIERGRA